MGMEETQVSLPLWVGYTLTHNLYRFPIHEADMDIVQGTGSVRVGPRNPLGRDRLNRRGGSARPVCG